MTDTYHVRVEPFEPDDRIRKTLAEQSARTRRIDDLSRSGGVLASDLSREQADRLVKRLRAQEIEAEVVVTEGVEKARLRANLEALQFLVVTKRGRTVYTIPIFGTGQSIDRSDRRELVIEEHNRGEPAAQEYAKRQTSQWEEMLEKPVVSYREIDEGIYVRFEGDLYYLGMTEWVRDAIERLTDALEHDATVDDIADADPTAVFQGISDVVDAFDVADLGLDDGGVAGRPDWQDGGLFESWLDRNLDPLLENLDDHTEAYGIDVREEGLDVMFGYNTQNFTFSTRFLDESLGISRQFTNVPGSGYDLNDGGLDVVDAIFSGGPFGGDDLGTEFEFGDEFGFGDTIGFGDEIGFEDTFGFDDAPEFEDGFGFERDLEDGPLSMDGMLGDGEGLPPGFGVNSGPGGQFAGSSDNSSIELFDSNWDPVDEDQNVFPVPFTHIRSEEGDVNSWVIVDEDGNTERVWAVDTEEVPGYGDDEPEGGDDPDGGPDEPEGGDDPDDEPDEPEGGDEPDDGPDEPEGGDEPDDGPDEPEGGDDPDDDDDDDDPEPGGGGEVGVTPQDGEGGGSGGSSDDDELPFGGLGGINGGCRGGGYTNPGSEPAGDGDDPFGVLSGDVCPMGGERLDSLTQPGRPEDEHRSDPGISEQDIIRDIIDALTQPGVPTDTQASVAGAGVTVRGVSSGFTDVEVAQEGDALIAGSPDRPMTDGGADGSVHLFQIAEPGVARETGMDRFERVVGAIEGYRATGLFGFSDTITIETDNSGRIPEQRDGKSSVETDDSSTTRTGADAGFTDRLRTVISGARNTVRKLVDAVTGGS